MVEVNIEILLAFRPPYMRQQQIPIPILSIPRTDVERLAAFPFRWLRFVMFTICGAHGNIYTTHGLGLVNYDRTEVADDENEYFYVPLAPEDLSFIDFQGLNDRITGSGSVLTESREHFREGIIRRDGHRCVVSQVRKEVCDAVHLIPRSKGDAYIATVIELRSHSRDIIGIDDIRNVLLLNKMLHSDLRRGEVAFIKTTTTPNSVLRPEDIKRIPRGDPRQDYITLQWLKKPDHYDPALLADYQTRGNVPPRIALDCGANVDALFPGEGGSLPSPVILDYAYGVAAYKCWRSRMHVGNGGVPEIINNYRNEHYAHIPPLPPTPPDDTDDTDTAPEPDEDASDVDYIPGANAWKRHPSRRDESEIAKAMDELNVLLMAIVGTTPEEVAERTQKKNEQWERAAQEASRNRVMEWRRKQLNV